MHNCDEIEREVLVCDSEIQGIDADVVRWDVQAHVREEDTARDDDERFVLEEFHVDEFARFGGWEFVPAAEVGDDGEEEGQEGDCADGPAEADFGLELAEDDGVDEAAWGRQCLPGN